MTASSDAGKTTAGPGGAGVARRVPIMGWLRGYQRGWLARDAVAGVTEAIGSENFYP